MVRLPQFPPQSQSISQLIHIRISSNIQKSSDIIMPMSLAISIGVMAHNEERNIGRLLRSLLAQKLHHVSISEIIVVSSGSSDRTNDIVKEVAKKDTRIRLLNEQMRKGKSSAVNLFLQKAKKQIVIIMSADLLLEKGTLEQLVLPLRDKKIGLTGCHPVPINDPHTFLGFAARILWGLHHKISLQQPKMGEMIAFRKVFKRIPSLSAVDEANIEPLIRGQGYTSLYVPNAIVYNKGPETIKEFIARRRHVYAGHLATKKEYSYEVATMSGFRIFWLLLQSMQPSWRYLLWTPFVILLEIYSRILGYLDYTFKLKSHTIWEMTPSTKKLS